MKTILYISCLLGIVLSCTTASYGQYSPGKAGKFGIDGDLISDQALSGIGHGAAAGTHDWFYKPGGTGIGLFDTTGADSIRQRIMAGENLEFTRKMQYSRYSVQGGDLLMDASYTRDHISIQGTTVVDKTIFLKTNTIQSKLGDDPTTWKTVPTGGTLPAKTDIVDTYVNMRRNGTSTSSNIFLHFGATTLDSDGDRYLTFILSKSRMEYNPSTGSFTNTGSSETGGHTAWIFKDTITATTGDLAISFSLGSGGVNEIQLLIWCNYKDYKNGNPANFDFVNGQWYGVNPKSGWGWAGIKPNAGGTMQAWGAVNTAKTAGPPWGTNSRNGGVISTSYATGEYSPYQFAEAAIDLTSAGLEFGIGNNGTCEPPFTRYFVATREASGLSAPMMDFIGPYEFLDAPTVSAAIQNPGPFTCSNNSSLSLSPASYIKGAYYSWRTTNGSIVSSSEDSSTIKINKPGTYVLTAAMVKGCNTSQDSIIVGNDNYKPVAKASNTGISSTGGSATLFGGDPVASNYTTPFGGSKGLTYKWTGPGGFQTSTLETVTTTKTGDYQLVVTEIRNGCRDTAYTTVSLTTTTDSSTLRILAVKFSDFAVQSNPQQKLNNLFWKVADASEVEKFVVEKSANGTFFSPAGYVFADQEKTSYTLSDPATGGANYYRIKAFASSGSITFSQTLKVQQNGGSGYALLAYKEGSGSVVVNYTSPVQEVASIAILSMEGQVLKKVDRTVAAGSNVFRISDLQVPSGIYLVKVQNANYLQTTKVKL